MQSIEQRAKLAEQKVNAVIDWARSNVENDGAMMSFRESIEREILGKEVLKILAGFDSEFKTQEDLPCSVGLRQSAINLLEASRRVVNASHMTDLELAIAHLTVCMVSLNAALENTP